MNKAKKPAYGKKNGGKGDRKNYYSVTDNRQCIKSGMNDAKKTMK